MKICRRLILGGIISLCFFGALMAGERTNNADAAWLENFTVRATTSQVIWNVTICEAWRIRRISVTLTPENGWPTYTRTSTGGFQDGGCVRWRVNTKNIWLEGIWYTKLSVVLNTGEILRTKLKEFYLF